MPKIMSMEKSPSPGRLFLRSLRQGRTVFPTETYRERVGPCEIKPLCLQPLLIRGCHRNWQGQMAEILSQQPQDLGTLILKGD